MLHESEIIASLGIIENDFYNRKDLSPNICALYVEKDFRRQGIAEKLLQEACDDMKM
ncbi:GNAT family N-acetyltransferase [Lactococcus garvieae]